MPTLAELKAKWFIDVSDGGPFPRQTRHPGTQVQPSTDGNQVIPLIDGQELMADFKDRVDVMIGAPDPTQHELWIASWRLDPVKLLGETNAGPTATELILNAASSGVKVRYLGSGHLANQGVDADDFSDQLKQRGSDGTMDERFPRFGSQHQKFNVFRGPGGQWAAVLGSADLSFTRWDTRDHAPINNDRPDAASHPGGPTHDVAALVLGPAVHDVALTFAERWNDTPSRDRTDPVLASTIAIDFLGSPIPIPSPYAANHSVQVLRTYGMRSGISYSFTAQGEFTIWASYLNAIKQATKYIYIEDQYFWAFRDPPAFEAGPGRLRDSSVVYQLGEALKRGVHVVLVLAGRSEDMGEMYTRHQRGRALHFLTEVVASHSGPPPAGRFVPCFLQVGGGQPVVHSKLMIVDDEFVIVGSANINQRSMAHDSELDLAIVDESGTFARDLRLQLWQEHMQLLDTSTIFEPLSGVVSLENSTVGHPTSRLRLLPTEDPGFSFMGHGLVWDSIPDPYAGPDRSD